MTYIYITTRNIKSKARYFVAGMRMRSSVKAWFVDLSKALDHIYNITTQEERIRYLDSCSHAIEAFDINRGSLISSKLLMSSTSP